MKVTRAGFLVVLAVAILSVAGIRARSSRLAAGGPQLTFAQLTDAHLFDPGREQSLAEVGSQAADNWNALHWSIDRINALTRKGKQIDFIVYTGDFGLDNVAFPEPKTCLGKPPMYRETGLPTTLEETASRKLIAELDRLTVRTIFLVSGDDHPGEGGRTEGAFECLLLSLQESAQALERPLRIQKLVPDHCFALKGFHLLGLNSPSSETASNYADPCVPREKTGAVQDFFRAACPENKTPIHKDQVESDSPTLLFTYVPDSNDPSRVQPSWDLERSLGRELEKEGHTSNVLGIFAGHFNGLGRSLEPSGAAVRALALNPHVGGKTYIGPPLAIRNQTGRAAGRRGFLLVTASRTGISKTEVEWFEGTR